MADETEKHEEESELSDEQLEQAAGGGATPDDGYAQVAGTTPDDGYTRVGGVTPDDGYSRVGGVTPDDSKVASGTPDDSYPTR